MESMAGECIAMYITNEALSSTLSDLGVQWMEVTWTMVKPEQNS